MQCCAIPSLATILDNSNLLFPALGASRRASATLLLCLDCLSHSVRLRFFSRPYSTAVRKTADGTSASLPCWLVRILLAREGLTLAGRRP